MTNMSQFAACGPDPPCLLLNSVVILSRRRAESVALETKHVAPTGSAFRSAEARHGVCAMQMLLFASVAR